MSDSIGFSAAFDVLIKISESYRPQIPSGGSRGMFQGEVEFCEEGLPAGLASGEVLFGEKVAGGDVVREHGEGSVEEVVALSAEAVDHDSEFFFVGGVVKFGGAPFLTFV